MSCIKITETAGCLTTASGSQPVTIVREYSEQASGYAQLVRTHVIDAVGNHITLGATDELVAQPCLQCCGSLLIEDLLPVGNPIATITNSEGQSFVVRETVTTLTLAADVSGPTVATYTSEDGTVTNIPGLNVLTTVQPTPTATGNTTNLNSVFKDATGTTWVVDANGDAVMAGAAVFKEQNRFYADPNGSDSTGTGANENPFATAQAAVDALGQADTAVLNEGTYGAVTMATQNTTISGASNGYSGLVNIASLTATASGTSVRAEGLTVVGNVSHTGTAPLYLNNVTVNGNYTSSSTAYTEIKDSRIQAGTISKTAAGALFIRDSQIGAASFTTAGSQIIMRDVAIDLGDCVTIGAGVVYSLSGVQGCVNIDPAAIDGETAAIGSGVPAALAEAGATTLFNNVRITDPDTESSPTQIVTWDSVTGELEISPLATISGDRYKTTSTTCQDIVSTGNITLTVQPGLAYTPLQDIIVYADASNHMHGQVVSYNTATGVLVMEVHQKTGSGNFCNWTVNLDAIKLAEVSVYFGSTDPITAGQAGIEGDLWYKTSNGTNTGTVQETWVYDGTTWVKVDAPSTGGVAATDEFTAVNAQTSFTLTAAPTNSVVWFFRDGVRLSKNAATVSGTTVTYVPSGNNGSILNAGDRITIDYITAA